MSWFNQSSLSSFAKTALSTAQKSIDKVLDIQEEGGSDDSKAAQSSGDISPASSLSKSAGTESAKSIPNAKLQSIKEDHPSPSEKAKDNVKPQAYTPKVKSQVSVEDDPFFSAFLSGNEPAKPKKSIGKKIQTPAKTDDITQSCPGEKPPKVSSSSGKNSKTKSKITSLDSDDSDEIGTERRTGKSGKKSHLGSRKGDSSRETKNEAVMQPLQIDVGRPEPVLPQNAAPPLSALVSTEEEVDSKKDAGIQESISEDSAINPEILKSTESFLLVKSSDAKELGAEPDSFAEKPLGQSYESGTSTSTGTVEADDRSAEHHVPARRKSGDLDVKSESENTDEQTSVKSDSDFVVINENTASEQSSVYLYDTRESPENASPKHYSSSSNGKRSPTDSDFSIISEGRFNDMHDSMHSGAQSQDVGNIVEQASMALIHRVSPSYSADVESEDQDDKMTPSSSTDERPRSSSEEAHVIREETCTPTPKESESQESLPDTQLEEETPRLATHQGLEAAPENAEEVDQDSAMQPHKLLKKLAEMAQVLEARESQIIHLSQQNGELQESVSDLKNQITVSEEKRKSETYDLQNLTDEFTQRISAMERKLHTANRERDQFKKDSTKMQKALNDMEKNDATSKLLMEKDEQITELLAEGEKLSKQQLQNSNIIKKLRVKEKETDKLLKTQKDQLEESKSRVTHLEEVLDGKEEVEKKQKDTIKTLNAAVERQEKEILNLKSELEEGREKVRSTQHALDASYKEIAELHRGIAAKESKVHETALSAEMNAKEELKLALDRSQLEARRQHEGLLLQVNDLQLSLNRADQQNARKEDSFRQEISDLQQRLQEAEARNQELSQSVTAATRPLLRQIENLQATFNAQSLSWEQVERSLTERLSEAQTQLAISAEKERGAQEAALEASSKLAALESQLAMLRQEKSRLTALLEVEKARVESLEESKTRDFSHMENQLQNYLRSVEEAQRDKAQLEKQLHMEKLKVETERKKLSLTQEALEEKERRLQQTEENSGSHSPNSRASTPNHAEFRPNFFTSISRTPSQGEILERTMSTSMTGSVYDSVVSGSATSIIESLQSQLKQREGEISQLQSEIFQLERTRSSMAEEIVKLTNQTEKLEEEVSYIPELRIQLKDLQHRYNAVLQMYGEKAEEVQELKLDLQDVKEMYRQQIEDLIRGST